MSLALLSGRAVAAGVSLSPGKTEVLVAPRCPGVVRFAADEMTNFLSRVLGAPVPIVTEPHTGRASVILGANAWSKAAGLDPTAHPHDTYLIRTTGDRIFVLGVDDPKADPRKRLYDFERGTLHGVYAFLEKFAGCRFYFPGELGEVIPKASCLVVPETDLVRTPPFLVRTLWSQGDGAWPKDCGYDKPNGKALNWLRLRMSSTSVPCCHGTARMKLLEKYGKTHPEYFALNTDGTRHVTFKGKGFSRAGQLCFSNPGLRDVVYAECLERFGKGAKFVDVMPNDAYPECHCPDCQKAYNKADKNFATELIWSYTADLANRLKRDGIPGKLTQMAYHPYGRIPDFDLPDNVAVMVAVGGPWARPEARQKSYEHIRAWTKKTGGSVWIWTYPRKADATQIKGVPDVAPRAHGEFFKGIADSIFGSFLNSDTDEWINHYFNYYLFSRVAWEGAAVDVDAVIAEHHRLMFGAAAEHLAVVYDLLERTWLEQMVGNTVMTAIGPVVTPPSERDVWTKVYSPAFRVEIRAHFDAAAKKVAADSLEARRIAFFRRYFLDLMEEGAAEWQARRAEIESVRWNPAEGPLTLALYGGDKKCPEPQETKVSARLTESDLVFTFDCAEARLADVQATERPHDDEWLWQDASIAVLVNPSGDRQTFGQIIVNRLGVVADVKGIKAGRGSPAMDWKWESHARAKVMNRSDGYTIEVAVPQAALRDLGGLGAAFPVEFMRVRATKSGTGLGYYKWGRFSGNALDVETWGTLVLPSGKGTGR